MKAFLQSITTRLALSMIMIAILPLLVIAYSLQYQKREEVATLYLSHLNVVFKQTLNTISTNIQYQKQLLVNIASMPRIAEKLNNRHSHQMLYLDPSIQAYVTNVVSKYGYYDFFIITDTGEVVYSFKKEEDYGKNVHSPLLNNTGLLYVFEQASRLLDTSISPLEYYPISKRKASFIATPIIVNQKIIGVVAVQLNENYIFDLIKSYNGLGQSGEVVAGTLMKDGRVLAAIPLKYDPNAFKNERVLNSGMHASGMIQAVKGHSGAGEITDYRGVKSLAVWGYEPTLKWGIVVKTDQDEVLSGIYQDFKQLLAILFFVIVTITVTIIMSVKHITEPIKNLIRSVQKFREEGTFEPSQIACEGEICYLSEEFNAMVEEIESHNKNLEEKIEKRTQELKTAKKEVENYVTIVDRFVITSSTDISGNITYASKAFEEISGYSESELLGKNHRILRDPQMPKELFKELWQTISSGHDWHGEIRNIAKDGKYYWVDVHITPNRNKDGIISGYTAIRQNITDKKMIEELSITDQLTGLYNRRHLDAVLNIHAQIFERYTTPFSIMIIDIDYFKMVNDTYGHQVGDSVLQSIATILKKGCRAIDIVGRWGGEEFLVIFPNSNKQEATEAAEKLRIAIETYPFDVIGNKTASFGVSEYYDTVQEMVRRADNALYQAKEEGRNRVCTL